MYLYSVLAFEDSPPMFLGKGHLEAADDTVYRLDYNRDLDRPVVVDGCVEYPWGDEAAARVPLPATVDTSDPWQVAPMASFWSRPVDVLRQLARNYPETVYVFEVGEDETSLDTVDAATYHEDVEPTDEPGVSKVSRWYEWDDDAVPPASGDHPHPADATHIVGFTDGQDLHDPYSHLGFSHARDASHALRDVLGRLGRLPLWTPEARRVERVRAFPAATVFNPMPPIPE